MTVTRSVPDANASPTRSTALRPTERAGFGSATALSEGRLTDRMLPAPFRLDGGAPARAQKASRRKQHERRYQRNHIFADRLADADRNSQQSDECGAGEGKQETAPAWPPNTYCS